MKKILSTGLLLATLLSAAYAQAAVFQVPSNAPPKVTMTWNISPDNSVIGYNVYYGVSPSIYTNRTQVGNVQLYTMPLPARGTTFYFVATAYNGAGLESSPSNEAVYRTPDLPAPPSLLRTNNIQLAMKVESAPTAEGPWTLFATLGTEVTSPAYFRGLMQVKKLLAPEDFPPVPGGSSSSVSDPTLLKLVFPTK